MKRLALWTLLVLTALAFSTTLPRSDAMAQTRSRTLLKKWATPSPDHPLVKNLRRAADDFGRSLYRLVRFDHNLYGVPSLEEFVAQAAALELMAARALGPHASFQAYRHSLESHLKPIDRLCVAAKQLEQLPSDASWVEEEELEELEERRAAVELTLTSRRLADSDPRLLIHFVSKEDAAAMGTMLSRYLDAVWGVPIGSRLPMESGELSRAEGIDYIPFLVRGGVRAMALQVACHFRNGDSELGKRRLHHLVKFTLALEPQRVLGALVAAMLRSDIAKFAVSLREAGHIDDTDVSLLGDEVVARPLDLSLVPIGEARSLLEYLAENGGAKAAYRAWMGGKGEGQAEVRMVSQALVEAIRSLLPDSYAARFYNPKANGLGLGDLLPSFDWAHSSARIARHMATECAFWSVMGIQATDTDQIEHEAGGLNGHQSDPWTLGRTNSLRWLVVSGLRAARGEVQTLEFVGDPSGSGEDHRFERTLRSFAVRTDSPLYTLIRDDLVSEGWYVGPYSSVHGSESWSRVSTRDPLREDESKWQGDDESTSEDEGEPDPDEIVIVWAESSSDYHVPIAVMRLPAVSPAKR